MNAASRADAHLAERGAEAICMSAPNGASAALHVVVVSYQLPPQAFAAMLQGFAAKCGVNLRGVVVSNNPSHTWQTAPSGLQPLRGSNSLLDFSGYFEGLVALLKSFPDAALGNVLFVNDSLVTKHAASVLLQRVIALDRLLQQIAVPALGGKLDPYRAFCLKNPWSGHAGYITSFCFLLNTQSLVLLQQLAAEAEAAGLLGGLPLADPLWGHGLPHDLREMIRAHLLYEGSPMRWPGTDKSPSELLQRKACCAFFEHRLSGLVGQAGVVVPINAGPRSAAIIAVGERWARLRLAARALAGLKPC